MRFLRDIDETTEPDGRVNRKPLERFRRIFGLQLQHIVEEHYGQPQLAQQVTDRRAQKSGQHMLIAQGNGPKDGMIELVLHLVESAVAMLVGVFAIRPSRRRR